MKSITITVLVIITISIEILHSQHAQVPYISDSRLVNWSNAGLLSDTPVTADNVVNINEYPTGSDYNKIVNAINDANNLPGTTIIYFPAGTYTLDNTISLSNIKDEGIIFQGDGSESTTLIFDGVDADDHCFSVSGGYGGSLMTVSQNISKGSNTIGGSFTGLSTGDWIHLCEADLDDDYNQTGYVGQITQLESVYPSTLTMKDEASKQYLSSNNLWVRKINKITNIGFENFKIMRTNTEKGNGGNINFSFAVNCWVKGVESYMCTGYHINSHRSSHINISGCYIHSATNYDSYPGTGYGVSLGTSTTNCLIENNIFKTLRHAMILGMGANCNVFRFNYSFDQTWDMVFGGWDLCLHGRYPYSNLFEFNSIERIWADPTHGINGPYNTFLRNYINDNTEIVIFNSSFTNIVGNDNSYGVVTEISWLVDAILQWVTGYTVNNSSNTKNIYFNYYPEGYPWDEWTEITHESWELVFRPDAFYYASIYPLSFINDISYYNDDSPPYLNMAIYGWPSYGPNTNLNFDGLLENWVDGIPAVDRYQETVKTYLPIPTIRPAKVYVENKYNDANLGNTLTINTTNNINSGDFIWLDPGVEYSVKTNYPIIDTDNFNHHHWNNDLDKYKLQENITADYGINFFGIFEEVNNISINSNISVDLSIHDPWYYDQNTQTQPDDFRPITPGQYQVFFDQDYDPGNPNKPYYSLRAPSVGQVTQNDIMVFDSWTVSPSNGATLNANSATTTVVFHDVSSPITITANYVSALGGQGKEVTIPASETVNFPAGGTYLWDNANTGF
ncbi:MAG: right-handed parallel beta-helix repeat-containing protein, partial [Candidatus Marinimicrobia bacterium]|nr:right-handed parallel beta-helix repeat-containing protein [Candidatus Neomarinimicrobiota bacterium]